MLGLVNRTIPLSKIVARAKWEQHHATSTNVAWIFDHFQPAAKRPQLLNATNRNIVGRNMFRAFGHHVARCWDQLGIENRTTAQNCCTDLAKLQHQAPAKWSQHFIATYRNTVGGNMLRAFGQPCVVTCGEVLGFVGSNLKMVKFFI